MKPRQRGPLLGEVAVLGLGKAGGSLLASLDAAAIEVIARGRRLDALARSKRARDVRVLFLAVPDAALEATAAAVRDSPLVDGALELVLHLAGARGLDALAALRGRVDVGSFHPLASLDGKSPIPPGTLLAWDCSSAAWGRAIVKLARECGGAPVRVPDGARNRYHAGAVVAGNLPMALLASGVRLLVDAGVPESLARVSLARLLRSQADNATRMPLAAALTGPVARGDEGTLRRHLALLDEEAPDLAGLYRALSHVLVDELTKHSPRTRARLHAALASDPGES